MADLRITGKMLHSNRLTFETNDHDAIRQQLNKMMGEASYQGALVVLDTTVEQELIALIQLVVSLELQPIGVVEGLLSDQARAIQFPIVPADRPLQRIKPTKEQVVEAPVFTTETAQPQIVAEPVKKVISHTTSYHDEILRTGQCLVQDHGDIILNAGINSGSEVIASGNIHIYGSVRGRVIAGAGGNTAARIFCHSLEAELVSIAGTYCVADDIPQHVIKQSVHIYLNDQQELEFQPLQF